MRFATAVRPIAAVLCAVAIACAALALTPARAVAAATTEHSQPQVETVVIILTPFLTWDDITIPKALDLRLFAGEGAVGNMNSITADMGWPTVAGGALTLSSGRWTAGPIVGPATPANLGAIQLANTGSLNPPDLGALGSVLRADGLKTAAVGNADEDTSTPAGTRHNASLVAFDRTGAIDTDVTDASLLTSAAGAPFGVMADRKRFAAAIATALAAKPALLVIDPGDLSRAHDAPNLDAGQAARAHDAAVTATSDIARLARLALGTTPALLMVVTPATDKPYYQPPYFGPTIVVGDGFHGQLTSASTHRPGLVTNLDVAPTALAALWREPTSTMIGQPMTSDAANVPFAVDMMSNKAPELIGALSRLGTTVGAIDYTRDLLFVKPFARSIALLAVVCAVLALVPRLHPGRNTGQTLILLALAIPAGAWLLYAIDRYPQSPGRVALAFAISTFAAFALVWMLAVVLGSRPEVPLLAMSMLTSLLICLDQWTRQPFESGLFSYSIRAGWRYYGMGNEGAALLVGASIIAVGLACDLAQDTAAARPMRLFLMPAVGAIALATAAAPFLGANAGVALWGVVAYGVAWARVNQLRLTWRTLGAIVVAIVALVAVLATIDMLSGGAETHLGRFAASFAGGDFAAIQSLVVRKALNNYNYLPQTPYTWLALALLGALAAMYWLGSRPLARALASRPGVSAALLGLLIGGAAATLSEDSGVVMPALMLFAGALPAISLALRGYSAEESLDPDVT
jgi:hypothetical protein